MLKAFSCGIEGELRNSHTQAQQGKTNHCQINVLLNYYTAEHLNKKTDRSPCFAFTHTPSVKIPSIWLYASSLFPKASFPAGSLREQRKGEGKQGLKERRDKWKEKETSRCTAIRRARMENTEERGKSNWKGCMCLPSLLSLWQMYHRFRLLSTW